MKPNFALIAGTALLLASRATIPSMAEEPLRIAETSPAGLQYHVTCQVELKGTLQPEPEKGKAARPVALTGKSAIEYDERILAVAASGQVEKTLRIYRRVDLQRNVAGRDQQQTIRPAVRRLVIMRQKNVEVPFSPDGPLAWGEIDLVRTDVFTPALAGLLPANPVKIGDRWTAKAEAVQELTDMERIEEGQLECRLEEIGNLSPSDKSRRHARISFAGAVRGYGEDGPNRQQLDGYLYFDLESNHITYLSLRGTHTLLDKSGKEVGKVEGRFTLTRQAGNQPADLNDEAIKGLQVEPNAENTLLLYENVQLGLRFLYPRRWRIASEQGKQIALDAADGNGLLLTIDAAAEVPTAAQFLNESRAWLKKQKASIAREESVHSLTYDRGQLERFALEVESAGQRVLMDYFVFRQQAGGGTLAARLLPQDLTALRAEIEKIARSITVSRPK